MADPFSNWGGVGGSSAQSGGAWSAWGGVGAPAPHVSYATGGGGGGGGGGITGWIGSNIIHPIEHAAVDYTPLGLVGRAITGPHQAYDFFTHDLWAGLYTAGALGYHDLITHGLLDSNPKTSVFAMSLDQSLHDKNTLEGGLIAPMAYSYKDKYLTTHVLSNISKDPFGTLLDLSLIGKGLGAAHLAAINKAAAGGRLAADASLFVRGLDKAGALDKLPTGDRFAKIADSSPRVVGGDSLGYGPLSVPIDHRAATSYGRMFQQWIDGKRSELPARVPGSDAKRVARLIGKEANTGYVRYQQKIRAFQLEAAKLSQPERAAIPLIAELPRDILHGADPIGSLQRLWEGQLRDLQQQRADLINAAPEGTVPAIPSHLDPAYDSLLIHGLDQLASVDPQIIYHPSETLKNAVNLARDAKNQLDKVLMDKGLLTQEQIDARRVLVPRLLSGTRYTFPKSSKSRVIDTAVEAARKDTRAAMKEAQKARSKARQAVTSTARSVQTHTGKPVNDLLAAHNRTLRNIGRPEVTLREYANRVHPRRVTPGAGGVVDRAILKHADAIDAAKAADKAYQAARDAWHEAKRKHLKKTVRTDILGQFEGGMTHLEALANERRALESFQRHGHQSEYRRPPEPPPEAPPVEAPPEPPPSSPEGVASYTEQPPILPAPSRSAAPHLPIPEPVGGPILHTVKVKSLFFDKYEAAGFGPGITKEMRNKSGWTWVKMDAEGIRSFKEAAQRDNGSSAQASLEQLRGHKQGKAIAAREAREGRRLQWSNKGGDWHVPGSDYRVVRIPDKHNPSETAGYGALYGDKALGAKHTLADAKKVVEQDANRRRTEAINSASAHSNDPFISELNAEDAKARALMEWGRPQSEQEAQLHSEILDLRAHLDAGGLSKKATDKARMQLASKESRLEAMQKGQGVYAEPKAAAVSVSEAAPPEAAPPAPPAEPPLPPAAEADLSAPFHGPLAQFGPSFRWPHIAPAEEPSAWTRAGLAMAVPKLDKALRTSTGTNFLRAQISLSPESFTMDTLRQYRSLAATDAFQKWMVPLSGSLERSLADTQFKERSDYFIRTKPGSFPGDIKRTLQSVEVNTTHAMDEQFKQVEAGRFMADLPADLTRKAGEADHVWLRRLNAAGIRRVPSEVVDIWKKEFGTDTGVFTRMILKGGVNQVWRYFLLSIKPGWSVANAMTNEALVMLKYGGVGGGKAFIHLLLSERGPKAVEGLARYTQHMPGLRENVKRAVIEQYFPDLVAGSFGKQLDRQVQKAGALRQASEDSITLSRARFVSKKVADATGAGGRGAKAVILAPKHLNEHFNQWSENFSRDQAVLVELKKFTGRWADTADQLSHDLNSLSETQRAHIVNEVEAILGDYSNLSAFEREKIVAWSPFYPWFKAILGITARYVTRHPERVWMLHRISASFVATANQNYFELGIPVPSFAASLIPLFGPQNGQQETVTQAPWNPFQTPVDIARVFQALATGDQSKLQPSATGLSLLGPAAQGLFVALSGKDPYFGGTYKGPGSHQGPIFSAIGSTFDVPQVRLIDQLMHNYKSKVYNSPRDSSNIPGVDEAQYLAILQYLGIPVRQVNLQNMKTRALEEQGVASSGGGYKPYPSSSGSGPFSSWGSP